MKFHLIQQGLIGRRAEIEQGLAGQRSDLFQRYLEEVKQYVRYADETGFAGYGHNEHHLQIEGFEASNHPGMLSVFIGSHSKRLTVSTFGYVLPTHNPVRAAEEIATLDHMLQGRLKVAFVRGYQSRWVDSYAALPGVVGATTGKNVKDRDDADTVNREVFTESLQIIKTAWTNSTFSYKGKYWQFPPEGGSVGHPAYEKFGAGIGPDGRVAEIGIAPLCYQQPHPKIYGAFAHSMRTVQMWAREGGKIVLFADSLDFCDALIAKYQETALTVGREVPKEDVAAWGGMLLLAKDKAHKERLLAEWDWMWDQWLPGFDQKRMCVIAGTADEVSNQIEEAWERLNFNEVWFAFGQGALEPEENIEMLDTFASKVMPRFAQKDETGMYV